MRSAQKQIATISQQAASERRSGKATIKQALQGALDPKEHGEIEELAQTGDDLVTLLVTAMADEHERLGMSIAVAELHQGNPLFVALKLATAEQRPWVKSGQSANKTALSAIDSMADAGLWKPDDPVHRAALASLCSPDALSACSWAASHGVSPLDAAPERFGEIVREVATHGLAKDSPFTDFCAPWSSQDGFSERLLDAVIEQCSEAIALTKSPGRSKNWGHSDHEATWAIQAASTLASRWSKLGPACDIAPPPLAAVIKARTALDEIVLGALDLSPAPSWAEEARDAAKAFGALSLPSLPSMRI